MHELRDTPLDDLEAQRQALDAEISRRHTLNNATNQIAHLNRTILDAQGHAPGDPWRPPSGGHDAYPEGWTVTHDGRTWVSRAHCNTSKPGRGEGWTDLTAP